MNSYSRYALILRTAERTIMQRATELYSTSKTTVEMGEKKIDKSRKKGEKKVKANPIIAKQIGKGGEKEGGKKVVPIVRAPKLLVSKQQKQSRVSKYFKKKSRLRVKRELRTGLAAQRAVQALDSTTQEHRKLMRKRRAWVPFPELFPLDLTGVKKRPPQINYNYQPKQKLKKVKKSDAKMVWQ